MIDYFTTATGSAPAENPNTTKPSTSAIATNKVGTTDFTSSLKANLKDYSKSSNRVTVKKIIIKK